MLKTFNEPYHYMVYISPWNSYKWVDMTLETPPIEIWFKNEPYKPNTAP